jgi:preprotein translocase subunit SecY
MRQRLAVSTTKDVASPSMGRECGEIRRGGSTLQRPLAVVLASRIPMIDSSSLYAVNQCALVVVSGIKVYLKTQKKGSSNLNS